MIIGVPKEIKNHEYRVALLPVGAEMLRKHRHKVLVQKGAGEGSGFSDAEYRAAGATIVSSAKDIFRRSDMIIKVKEPQPAEIKTVSYTHLTLPTTRQRCRSRWAPEH